MTETYSFLRITIPGTPFFDSHQRPVVGQSLAPRVGISGVRIQQEVEVIRVLISSLEYYHK